MKRRWVGEATVLPGIGEVEKGQICEIPQNCDWMLIMSGWEEVGEPKPKRAVRKPKNQGNDGE